MNNILECKNSCRNCSTLSNLKNACTKCHPNDYKISANFNDPIFNCSKHCDGKYLQLDDYFFCIQPSNPLIKISNPREVFYGPAIVASLFIICMFLFCLIKLLLNLKYLKNKRKSLSRPDVNVEMQPFNSVKLVSPIEDTFTKLKIISNTNDFKKLQEIGGGSFSIVYKGTLNGKLVALKIARKEGRKNIHKELQIYDIIKHAHIVPALGVHLGLENILFLELREYNLKAYFLDYCTEIKFIQLKQYCIQILDAMAYLHSKDILHCDLKIDNILVKDVRGDEIEISDFGCAIDLTRDCSTTFLGTESHMAYELLKPKMNASAKPTTKSDVWAFAVTAWQIFQKSAALPKDFHHRHNIIKNYESGRLLPQPSIDSENLWRYLILPCFNVVPEARPSISDLQLSLSTFR